MDVEKLIEEIRRFPVLYDQSNEKYRNSEYKEKVWKIIATNLETEGGVDECKRKWSSVRDQLRRTVQKRKSQFGKAALKYRKYKYEDDLAFLLPHLGERDGTSNLSKPEFEEHESNDSQEDFTQETYHVLPVGEEPTIEDENIPDTRRDNSFQSTRTSSSQAFGNENEFARPKAIKRKIQLSEEMPQGSPSAQLMAYILAEKKAEKNASRKRLVNPVDAFLGGIAPSLKSLNPFLLNEAKGRIFDVVQELEMRQLQISQGDFSMSNYAAVPSPSSESSSPKPCASPGDATIL